MAEKTTKKTTATKTAAKKTTAAKSTAGRATARDTEKTTARKTTRAAVAAPAAPAAAPAPSAAAVAARKTAVRKRTAATVARSSMAEAGTGWRRFKRKTKVGVVVSAKQPKTVIVVVGRMREHPLYKKVIHLRKRFAAHDEAGDVREGDLVRIQESRPFSATKRWRVVEVLSRTGEAGAAAPRVEEIEKLLEETEGVTALTRKPAEEREEETETEEA